MTSGGSTVLEPLWEELFASEELAAVGVVSRGIAPRREAVKDAREFTRTTLHRWGLGELFDDVALVASELVTNALRHAVRTDDPDPRRTGLNGTGVNGQSNGLSSASAQRGSPIRISLARQDAQIVCAVRDPSTAGPVTRTADHISETGRGLHLVDCFSDTWGWHSLGVTGKVVWAMFKLPGAELTGTA